MADSETPGAGDALDFPFEELYVRGGGWVPFIQGVFAQRFAGENFRVRLVTQKERRNSVPDYGMSFLVMWHLTEMAYVVEAPSIYDVVKKFTQPEWMSARLVLMDVTGVSRDGSRTRIKFYLG